MHRGPCRWLSVKIEEEAGRFDSLDCSEFHRPAWTQSEIRCRIATTWQLNRFETSMTDRSIAMGTALVRNDRMPVLETSNWILSTYCSQNILENCRMCPDTQFAHNRSWVWTDSSKTWERQTRSRKSMSSRRVTSEWSGMFCQIEWQRRISSLRECRKEDLCSW